MQWSLSSSRPSSSMWPSSSSSSSSSSLSSSCPSPGSSPSEEEDDEEEEEEESPSASVCGGARGGTWRGRSGGVSSWGVSVPSPPLPPPLPPTPPPPPPPPPLKASLHPQPSSPSCSPSSPGPVLLGSCCPTAPPPPQQSQQSLPSSSGTKLLPSPSTPSWGESSRGRGSARRPDPGSLVGQECSPACSLVAPRDSRPPVTGPSAWGSCWGSGRGRVSWEARRRLRRAAACRVSGAVPAPDSGRHTRHTRFCSIRLRPMPGTASKSSTLPNSTIDCRHRRKGSASLWDSCHHHLNCPCPAMSVLDAPLPPYSGGVSPIH
ncbi:hypothetical protein E2C01_004945 [Portunus trituberculatus]|uniref:Uncharacterized protein n=1 Tax=Portunus trituberculatus TaxID=210409 RepID=A0A5B7CXS5_PORTR|nr:hypothetical protein [Portunus trituberculatus]